MSFDEGRPMGMFLATAVMEDMGVQPEARGKCAECVGYLGDSIGGLPEEWVITEALKIDQQHGLLPVSKRSKMLRSKAVKKLQVAGMLPSGLGWILSIFLRPEVLRFLLAWILRVLRERP